MLNMRSGLYTYDDDLTSGRSSSVNRPRSDAGRSAGQSRSSICPYFRPRYGLSTTPNPHYALLGLIAEKIDGKPLAQIMHDLVCSGRWV